MVLEKSLVLRIAAIPTASVEPYIAEYELNWDGILTEY